MTFEISSDLDFPDICIDLVCDDDLSSVDGSDDLSADTASEGLAIIEDDEGEAETLLVSL